MKTSLANLLLAITAVAVAAADHSPSVKLDFPNADVNQVLALYESLTHFKLIRDNFVQGKITVAVAEPVTREKAIEVIERTLFANGYALTQIDPDTVEVTGAGKSAREIGIPVISDPKALPSHERLVSFVFTFKYRDAAEMSQIFGQHLSPPMPWFSILTEPKSNTALVTNRTSVIRQLIEIAAKMDVPDWQKKP
jgi:type II secretory pathway component GspD/PulD (secretin)